uniref:Uncharacterized protein n=1 Tax=Hyaloperonospora arabidopsidis (strain Emoy2) TaxID=559515 RepID=M4B508_HYAAE
MEAMVVQMHQSGAAPRVILNHLKETRVILKASDVHNIVQKANLEALCGKTHTEALMLYLKDKHITATVAVDQDNHVRYLFWQPDLSKDFSCCYYDVLVIDCMYKTNAYNPPSYTL